MRGKGRLVHGALETLTHTTQQVTTHSSEPHPQASGVVPSSHTMRWLLAVSCLSLSRAVPIPTSPITAAPETRAPPTLIPLSPCQSLSSPPLVASVKAPIRAAYSECWTFQCVGTVEVTFRNIRSGSDESRVTLQNSDGYVLTSLVDSRERYIATYPANGEMMVVLNDTSGYSYYEASVFTFEWVCNTVPAVVPAAGFDASTYLTLPPAGTYERMYSEQSSVNWLIPCTGTLDIAAASIFRGYSATFQFINNQGAILHTGEGSFSFNKKFNVADNFIITMRVLYSYTPDSEFTLAWSCGGTRPDLPSHDLTSAPETRAPPTLTPLSPCESLSAPPLVASVKAPIRAAYSECWTFQCVGTVEVTFRNIRSGSDESRVTLQNSDGYVLTSLVDSRERYIATYPANGEMMVVLNDTSGYSYYEASVFTFEWVCNTGPAVVPAAGFDASTYLTLPPAGTYERMYSEQSSVNWLIPCTGTLDIAAASIFRGYSATFQFINNQGAILHTGEGSFSFNKKFNVADNFIITMRVLYSYTPDSEFTLAWSCGGTRPDLPSHDLTPAPETRAPPTLIPLSPCQSLSSPPLVASVKAPIRAAYSECWTFQCVGTVEVTFRNIRSGSDESRVTLQNSDGYVLTSLVDSRERYIATYPANGEMMVVLNDTSGYSYYEASVFTFEWVCNTGPAVVPAAGFDASTYLTLPPAGTYERMYSEQSNVNWLIPCTGTLDIAAASIFRGYSATFQFINNQGAILHTGEGSFSFNKKFNVADNFIITMRVLYSYTPDSEFTLAWSCGSATAAPDTATPTRLPAGASSAPGTSAPDTSLPTTTPTPDTATPTNLPDGASYAPGTSELPTTTPTADTATPTSRPAGASYAPRTSVPTPAHHTALPTVTPTNLPAGASSAPGTSAPDTSLPTTTPTPDTATPTNLPDGASYAPGTSELPTTTPTADTATPTSRPAGASYAPRTSVPTLAPTPAPTPWSAGTPAPAPTLPPTPAPTVVPRAPCEALLSPPLVATIRAPVQAEYVECWTFQCVGTVEVTFRNISTSRNGGRVSLQNSDGYVLTSLVDDRERYIATYPANGEMMVVFNDTKGRSNYRENKITFEWVCHTGPAVVPAAGFDASTNLTLPPAGTYERMFSELAIYSWLIPCTGTLDIAALSSQQSNGVFTFMNSNGTILRTDRYTTTFNGSFSVAGNFNITLHNRYQDSDDSDFVLTWSCGGAVAATFSPLTPLPSSAPMSPGSTMIPATNSPIAVAVTDVPTLVPSSAPVSPAPDTALPTIPATNLPAGVSHAPPTTTPTAAPDTATPTSLPAGVSRPPRTSVPTPAPDTALPTATPTAAPDTATPTNLPDGASYVPGTSAPDTALPTTTPTPAPDTATPTNLPDGASFAPRTSAPDTALPTATPTDQPAGATFAPSAPAVKALCTTDKDCRSGRLDPKATCNAGTCVCHTQGYVHPTGVPLCLLADDVTVPMAFAVEYYGVEAGPLWTTATTRESFEETMSEALGIVTDMRVVVSDGGVLVVGMVRASTAKLADALSGKVDLSEALSSDGVSVSHGVTCARTDASYTVQHNGVCDAAKCEDNTTLTLTDGTHTCEREAAPLQPEESGGSSNVVLYVGIGVGVLVVAVCVVAAFCRLQKKQRVKEFENPLFEMSLDDAELYPTVEEVQADAGEELMLL